MEGVILLRGAEPGSRSGEGAGGGGGGWPVAWWVYDLLFELVGQHLPAGYQGPLAGALREADEAGARFLDLSCLRAGELGLYLECLSAGHEALAQGGPEAWPRPELYPEVMDRLAELIALVAADPRLTE